MSKFDRLSATTIAVLWAASALAPFCVACSKRAGALPFLRQPQPGTALGSCVAPVAPMISK
ncbi:MAG: hypothetical protein J6I32_05425 [Bacteroidaceae bacterium]|nr:hypothetical protein [Bacteroidaceae bacterium]